MGSLTVAKGCSDASFCWHFETPGAVDDLTTHNKPDLLASTTSRDLVKPVRTETHHQNRSTAAAPEAAGTKRQTTTADHIPTPLPRTRTSSSNTQNYYPPPTPTGSREARPGQKSELRRTSPEKKGTKMA
ncbi:hypothetical protein RHGRI_037682 [Rhododendron griersonianum]|uniref:Uncharacterized protein n=1 Tax=Rhododendron griersonianum TaxID=479676 RepID=A0AAV6HY26_9ERIC|nr:hypothetical protein RHGRI_037682 [Rhododendron griersonianum]